MTEQHHRKTRPDPNVSDPLSEPTLGRRIWAAYLQRGYTRGSFARAVGAAYVTVDRHDTGKVIPELDHVMRASELLGYSSDELYYGYHKPHLQRSESELSRDAIKALLHEERVAPEQVEALGEHERSPAGTYQRFTRTYVLTFCERHAVAVREGMTPQAAIDAAKVAAANARASAEANALRLSMPPSDDELAALGRSLEKEARPRKRKRTPAVVQKRKRA